MRTPREPNEPGGVISDHTGAHRPATEAMPHPPATGSGWLLGARYRVIDRVGAGGMAEVFRAHDELLARDVAVKVFRTHPVNPDTATGSERQEIELHALARLNHPNLIRLFDGSITGADGPAFLVMELINGPTLAARIADGPLTEPEVREVGIQIADALAYVHAEGMVHRDVKPANILLGTDCTTGDSTVRARLSDFGIVRLLGSERLTSVDFMLGTASYLAPEQARGSDVGPVADVYSLGLVLIEAATGVRSFDGPPLEAVVARLARDPEVPGHLPPPWPALLAAMTASDPAARPTAAQVAQLLRDGRSESVPLPIAAGLAGVAGAAGAADAETAGLAAVGAHAAGLSSAVVDPSEATDQRTRRGRAAFLLPAAGLLAALAVSGALLLRPTTHRTPPVNRPPGASNHATGSTSPGTHSSAVVPANDPVASPTATRTRTRSTRTRSTPQSSSARSSAASSTARAPGTSTAPGTSVPATTAAPASSSLPVSSAAASSTTSPGP